ncbi:MAG: lipoprotein-releasing ABC transporter permease subunit [Deltaproteobacteria bacterium]|nr:lipoprotein-releasing ABC transporter permease subunit [Deltaproteobacteria bacterium]
MRFELFVALRHLLARRKQVFISLISLISILGIALGVMALVVVIAVMSGFEKELKQKILGNTAHIMVMKYGGGISGYQKITENIKQIAEVEEAAPFVFNQAMLTHGRQVSGAGVRGIEQGSDPLRLKLEKMLVDGHFFSPPGSLPVTSPPEIILGSELAKNIGVRSGSDLRLIAPSGSPTPMGLVPRMQRFKVIGTYTSGMYQYDSALAYTTLGAAQKFFAMPDQVTGIAVEIKKLYEAGSIAEKIQQKLSYPYWARDWISMNRNLFTALKLERVTMFVILALIIMVAAFNIISTLIMVVMEKHKEIAILKTMGLSSLRIMRIFVWEGMIIGTAGTILGLTGSLILCEILKRYDFITLPGDVYYFETSLPVDLQLYHLVSTAALSLILCFGATLYPSFRASRLLPAEALRYE